LAREMFWGTTPTIWKPNSLAAAAVASAVLPMEGTTSRRVFASWLSRLSKCATPRSLNDPEAARNSHLAWTCSSGKRLLKRTSGIGAADGMATLLRYGHALFYPVRRGRWTRAHFHPPRNESTEEPASARELPVPFFDRLLHRIPIEGGDR